jgi:4-hydroxy-2-oxoheptanedioate aldolase
MVPLDLSRFNLGCFVNVPSGHLVELVASAGMDFVIIDMEHGPIDWETLEHLILCCEAASTPCIVRVPERRREYVLKALDCGASGVQMPMINTKAEAEELVRLAKYPPDGIRGTAFNHRAAKFGLIPDRSAYLRESNQNTRVVLHIETVEAVNHIDDIVSVEGVDVIFIGPADLSVSMGYAHDMGNQKVLDTISYVAEKALSAGKTVGTLIRGADEIESFKNKGITYLCTTVQSMILKACNQYKEAIGKLS